MDKLKKVFSPGADHDDHVMYGTPEPKNTHDQGGSLDHEAVGSSRFQNDATAELEGKHENKATGQRLEQGVYDRKEEKKYEKEERKGEKNYEKEAQRDYKDDGKSGGGVMRQIFNPGGDKYDEQRYPPPAAGETLTTKEPLDKDPVVDQPDHGVMRQILNPGGDKYDEKRFGTVQEPEGRGATRGTTLERMRDDPDMESNMSVKSGVLGPYSSNADPVVSDMEPRDATTSGAMGATVLPVRTTQDTTRVPAESTYTERSHPLADQSATTYPSGAAALGAAGLGHEQRSSGLEQPYTDRAAYVPGSEAGYRGQGEMPSEGYTRQTGASDYTPSDNAGYHRAGERPAEGYIHQTKGPHALDMANVLDPNVHGEKQQSHHLGRDAAIGGAGLGAAGVGAYELGKGDHEERFPATSQPASRQLHQQTPSSINETAPLYEESSHSGHNKLHKKNDPRGYDDKHDRELQQAREREAAHGGDRGEKKEGFLHKILHPNDKSSDEAGGRRLDQSAEQRDSSGRVIDPHTGLPMDVDKYGSGAGGTDAAPQIHGYRE